MLTKRSPGQRRLVPAMAQTLDLAISVGLTTAQLAAQFAPVPALSVAVDVLIVIIQTCQQISSSRNASRQLEHRCHILLLAIRDSNVAFTKQALEHAVDLAKRTLQEVENRMTFWASKKGLEAFFCQREIQSDIQRCQGEITTCYQTLQLSSHLEIHNWQAEFELNSKRDHEELVMFLSEMKDGQNSIQQQLTAQSQQLTWIMTVMQQSIPEYPSGDSRRDGLETNLYSLQKQTGSLLPEPNLKRGEVRKMDPVPVKRLLVYDLYEGLYLGQQKVWMKQLRSINAGPKTIDRFYREAEIWSGLWARDQEEWNQHGTPRRILPFLGFCEDGPGYQYFVSSWQGNGTAREYLLQHPNTDRAKLIRGIAQGLLMLHTMDPPVVHGDLTASSVVIDDWGNPLLSDFGIAKVVEDVIGSAALTMSEGIHESIRWFAPEVNDERALSTRSDVYSFGMTVLELMTRKRPWANVKNSFQVVAKVANGLRPERPREIQNDNLWALVSSCWDHDPCRRPSIQQIVEGLQFV